MALSRNVVIVHLRRLINICMNIYFVNFRTQRQLRKLQRMKNQQNIRKKLPQRELPRMQKMLKKQLRTKKVTKILTKAIRMREKEKILKMMRIKIMNMMMGQTKRLNTMKMTLAKTQRFNTMQMALEQTQRMNTMKRLKTKEMTMNIKKGRMKMMHLMKTKSRTPTKTMNTIKQTMITSRQITSRRSTKHMTKKLIMNMKIILPKIQYKILTKTRKLMKAPKAQKKFLLKKVIITMKMMKMCKFREILTLSTVIFTNVAQPKQLTQQVPREVTLTSLLALHTKQSKHKQSTLLLFKYTGVPDKFNIFSLFC